LDRRRRPFVAMIDAQQAVPEVRLSERIARQILVSTKRGIEPLPHRNHQSLLIVSTASVAVTDRVYQFHNCKGRGQTHWRKTILPKPNAATVLHNMGVSDTIYLIFKS
jgi:hypothetical protein